METLGAFIPLILLIAVFYFFIIRPQNKQQKELQEMRNNIKVGDEIITVGGFYGIIYAIDDKNVVLEMLPDFTKLMVSKGAISRVIQEEDSLLDSDNVDDEVEETVVDEVPVDEVVEINEENVDNTKNSEEEDEE